MGPESGGLYSDDGRCSLDYVLDGSAWSVAIDPAKPEQVSVWTGAGFHRATTPGSPGEADPT
ncbi:MAG: hypothetical protein ACRDWA_13220 [Acidimicrobiia bacterium]